MSKQKTLNISITEALEFVDEFSHGQPANEDMPLIEVICITLADEARRLRGTPMTDEKAIESEIQAKNLNAPRLSPDKIDAVIVYEDYHIFPGTTLTVCCLTLRNGFTVTGESAAASPANFDVELGRKIARSHARAKIWALEGYLLRDRLARSDDEHQGV